MSSLGPVGSGKFSREEMNEHFSQAAKGDDTVFARMFISSDFLDEGGLQDMLYGTDVRTKHSKNFVRSFERLLRLARNCDVEGIIEDSLMQGAFGLLYVRMLDHAPVSGSATVPTGDQ